jgi:hypothetical protein
MFSSELTALLEEATREVVSLDHQHVRGSVAVDRVHGLPAERRTQRDQSRDLVAVVQRLRGRRNVARIAADVTLISPSLVPSDHRTQGVRRRHEWVWSHAAFDR